MGQEIHRWRKSVFAFSGHGKRALAIGEKQEIYPGLSPFPSDALLLSLKFELRK
jgi:hypothetical protein